MYRKAALRDRKRVYELICDMEDKTLPYEEFCSIFQEQLSSERFYCLVCELDGSIAGVLNLRFEDQLHHAACIAEVMEFSVEPARRNQGLGKRMLERACQIAKEHGCAQIEVACNQLRTDTHRFYEREGMHNFHFKFSKSLIGADTVENALGR